MHGNQWVLKIAVLKYYSVSKRGTTAKSNPKQATDPISLHTKFGDNSSNTFPLNERKPCVTPDIGRRTPDAGHRTSDIGHRTAKKAKIIYPPPRGVDIIMHLEELKGLMWSQKSQLHKESPTSQGNKRRISSLENFTLNFCNKVTLLLLVFTKLKDLTKVWKKKNVLFTFSTVIVWQSKMRFLSCRIIVL